ncbi:AAA family ATPase [Acidianus sulfidivorans JP7]|uniref:Putative adenylate kinase n=1 Tax=Acidianus sulfidivorans JP7 TaxID=619593 RepID=A0A2U9IN61_9CREN|nr:adenylate kinase family protein [Acidianus sulfidivorans]AWR97442.1 AAA family ATPase [Acidianus sulfidivorans JP7]
MRILITGTPGVGKTSVSKFLASKLSYEYFHVSSFIIERKLYSSFDPLRQTYNIDDEKVAKEINEYLKDKNNIVIETIYPSLIDSADKVIVLRRYPIDLYKELKNRGWNEIKIAENVESEILGVVLQEAIDWFKSPCQINTTGKSLDDIMRRIMNNECEDIDWLSDKEIEEFLLKLDKVFNSIDNT